MLRIALTVSLVLALTAPARADDYPTKLVRLVVPYAAGGGTDALARFLARGMEARLGQSVIVENKPGSGTTTGGLFVAKSAPDGYTLLIATSSTVAIAPSIYKNLAYDPTVDFTPISMVAQVPFVLITHPSLGTPTLADFIKLARAKPGELSYGSGGAGAPHHIFMELFKSMTGTDVKHVPYRGGGPALQDIVAGHIPVGFADVGPALELLNAGKLVGLGVTTKRRVETMPAIPTIDEAGVKGFEANSWQCIVAPANLPEPIVAKLNKILVEFMAQPESQAHFIRLGMQAGGSTPAELGAHIKSEVARWARVIKGIGPIQ